MYMPPRPGVALMVLRYGSERVVAAGKMASNHEVLSRRGEG